MADLARPASDLGRQPEAPPGKMPKLRLDSPRNPPTNYPIYSGTSSSPPDGARDRAGLSGRLSGNCSREERWEGKVVHECYMCVARAVNEPTVQHSTLATQVVRCKIALCFCCDHALHFDFCAV
jgi:hypothetical protein